jgi:hypothetical protein
MSWYSQGYDGLKQEEERMNSLGMPDRLWIPPDASKQILFVDDEPFCIYEHNPKMNGSFKNWMTCLRGVEDEAPCCEILGVKTRYFAGYYTVIDCSQYTDKKGVTHQYEIKFLLAKAKTLKKLKMKKESKGSLAGSIYNATRFDQKSPTCGDDFEFVKQVDLEKVFPHVSFRGKKLVDLWAKAQDAEGLARLNKAFTVQTGESGLVAKVVPFNYMELLKPSSVKDLRTLLKGAKIESWDDAGPAAGVKTGADEEVPF